MTARIKKINGTTIVPVHRIFFLMVSETSENVLISKSLLRCNYTLYIGNLSIPWWTHRESNSDLIHAMDAFYH